MVASTGYDGKQLELLPADELAGFLASRPEDQWFDRASSRVEARAVGDLMIGFANAEGGQIVIGIHDGKVEGVAGLPHLVNEWRQAGRDFAVPPVRHQTRMLAVTTARGSDHVLVIDVEASETVHENVKGESFLRVGDENRRLGAAEAQELRFDKGQSIYDGTAVLEATMKDLDPALVQRYIRKIRGATRREVALQARGLVRVKGEVAIPTVAGVLVLGRDPQQFFPEASIRLLRYGGVSRETGSRSNVLHDVRVQGVISAQIDGARRTLKRWIPTMVRLGPAGRFAPETQLPEAAWLEAVVNAVVHRSYSMGGDHVRVELFEDRLEVTSPGRLPGLVRLDNIRSTRFARNPRIARAIADFGYGRELGEGVNRMFHEMERVGLPTPLFTQPAASVRVTFLVESIFGGVLKELPPGSDRFVEWMSRIGMVTTTQATELLGESRPTVLARLHDLERHGFVEHVGSSPKDPRGYWRMRMPKASESGRTPNS